MTSSNFLNFNIDSLITHGEKSKIDGFLMLNDYELLRKTFTLYPHVIKDFIIAHCTQGEAVLKIGFRTYNISKNTIILLLPQTILEPISSTDDLMVGAVFFTPEFLSNILYKNDYQVAHSLREYPVHQLTNSQKELFINYAEIFKYYNSRDHIQNRPQILAHLLLAALGDISYACSEIENKDTHPTRAESISNQFLDLLYKNYKEERSSSFYAERLNLTPKYLSTLIKETTNKTIAEWVDTAVIAHARSILKTTDLTVNEIGYELNFPDSSQFCRFFKRCTGLTPNQYRREG